MFCDTVARTIGIEKLNLAAYKIRGRYSREREKIPNIREAVRYRSTISVVCLMNHSSGTNKENQK